MGDPKALVTAYDGKLFKVVDCGRTVYAVVKGSSIRKNGSYSQETELIIPRIFTVDGASPQLGLALDLLPDAVLPCLPPRTATRSIRMLDLTSLRLLD